MHFKNYRKQALIFALLALVNTDIFGQYSITGDATQTIDFTGFTGAGFTSGAATTGSLDSDIWAVDLSNDGTLDSDFGASTTTGVFAGGEETSQYNLGSWPPGQVRAFTYDIDRLGVRNGYTGHEGDIALIMRIQNNTGGEITDLNLVYDIQSRVTKGTLAEIEFYYSADNSTYTEIVAMGTGFAPTTNWGTAAVELNSSFSTAISDGSFYYLKWVWKEHDGDAAGIGIGEIDITATIAQGSGEGTLTAGTTNFGDFASTTVADPGEGVLDFTITDDASAGADAFPIQFTHVVFTEGSNDGIDDWSDVIAGARLEDGDGNFINATSIGTNSITFSGVGITSSDVGYVPDDGSETYTLSVWLNTSIEEEIDGDLLHITLIGADFNFSGATSTVTTTASISSNSSYNFIEVTGTNWGLDDPPSVVGVAEDFSLTVTALDIYGNTDLDDNTSTFLLSRGTTGSGSLTEGGASKTVLSAEILTSGKYTYTDLQHDTEEGFTMDIDDSGGTFLASSSSSIIYAGVSYQSIGSGNWTADFATIWEYWNGAGWTTATTYPTSADGSIYIRSGHDVSVDAEITVDQIIIENGGEISLDQNADVLTIVDGPDEDLVIENGGILSLSDYNALPLLTGTVQVQGGGTLSISVSRLNDIATSTQIDWQTDAVLYYPFTDGFSYNTTYFPNVASGTYPIFEIDGITDLDKNLWVLNGILKVSSANLDITGTNTTIRDGLYADGTVTLDEAVNFTGSNLHFGGTGSIDLNGESYSWSATTIEMMGDQEIFNGSITLDGSSVVNGSTYSLNDGANDNLDLTIKSGATINSDADGGLATTLAVGGTVTLQNELNYNFEGTNAQTLGFGSVSVTEAERVTINNSSGVILDSDLTIQDRLTLTSGVFATSSSTEVITISSGGVIAGASSTNYFDGPLEIQDLTTSYTFHVGDGAEYRPVLVTPSSSADITVEAIYSVPPNSTSVGTGLSTSMANLYWEIQRGSGSGDVTAQLYYKETTNSTTPDNDQIADGTNLRLIQYDGSSTWQDLGLGAHNSDLANLSSITGTISSFIGSSDYFTIGSEEGSTVLPVELVSFTAEEHNGHVLLAWSTASEINNDRFEVQHSTDGINFTVIGQVNGGGTVNDFQYYSYQHGQPSDGGNYYRLKQIDFDGAFEYSPIIWINMENRVSTSLVLWGNPVVENKLRFVYSASTDFRIRITNMGGGILAERVFSPSDHYEIDVSGCSSGIYVLFVDGIQTERFVIR